MIGVERVTSFDKLIHELNDSDSAPGLLALADGNGADGTAPHGSVLFAVSFLHGSFPQRSDTRPLQGTGPEADCLAEAGAVGTGLR